MVAVGHITERHAVEREAELVLVEAAHHDARRPLVRAERVGGLEVHTRQFLDRLERAGAGRQIVDLFRGDLLLLARDAAGEDHDLLELRGVGGGGDGRLLGDRGGAEHRRRDEHG